LGQADLEKMERKPTGEGNLTINGISLNKACLKVVPYINVIMVKKPKE